MEFIYLLLRLMTISNIEKNLRGQEKKFPPVESWNPELCVGQEFFINREGEWFYNCLLYTSPSPRD